MKVLLMAILFLTACNNNDSSEAPKEDIKQEDQNRQTDTRGIPSATDTVHKVDTGDYGKVSDSLKKL